MGEYRTYRKSGENKREKQERERGRAGGRAGGSRSERAREIRSNTGRRTDRHTDTERLRMIVGMVRESLRKVGRSRRGSGKRWR